MIVIEAKNPPPMLIAQVAASINAIYYVRALELLIWAGAASDQDASVRVLSVLYTLFSWKN